MLAPLLLGWVWPSKDVINPYIWANLSHYILITLYIKKIPKNTLSKFVIFPRIFRLILFNIGLCIYTVKIQILY
jgi:hypothetical protein